MFTSRLYLLPQLNPEVSPFQRNFVSEVKRCDEMERRLRFFDDQLVKEKKEEEEEKKFSPERDEFSRIKLEESRDEEESPAKYEHLDELDVWNLIRRSLFGLDSFGRNGKRNPSDEYQSRNVEQKQQRISGAKICIIKGSVVFRRGRHFKAHHS